MDARTLFRQGVVAIREGRDLARGRDLLLKSLERDPGNDMAWLWLARAMPDRAAQLDCVERALSINPANETAQKLKVRLLAATASPDQAAPSEATPTIQPLPRKTVDVPLTPDEDAQIGRLLGRAEAYLEAGDVEAAVAQWVEVLRVRVDHERALRSAAGHLWRMGYQADARELVQRALRAGTRVPGVFLTAIDMAERQGDRAEAAALRERVIGLPQADEQLLISVADYYAGHVQTDQALDFLRRAVEARPQSQALLVRLGDLLAEQERHQEAQTYYDRAVRLGARTRLGQQAERQLASAVPILTDRERGSMWLAIREAFGVGLVFLLLGWQDARLNLLAMEPRRWGGVLISLLGGYLLVTATSSPQQRPLASWLGGSVPPPAPPPDATKALVVGRALQEPTNLPSLSPGTRLLFGVVGAALLIVAFVMVFHASLNQVIDQPLPFLP